jgi:hypothetical protein
MPRSAIVPNLLEFRHKARAAPANISDCHHARAAWLETRAAFMA